jgi:hypothetical protein
MIAQELGELTQGLSGSHTGFEEKEYQAATRRSEHRHCPGPGQLGHRWMDDQDDQDDQDRGADFALVRLK